MNRDTELLTLSGDDAQRFLTALDSIGFDRALQELAEKLNLPPGQPMVVTIEDDQIESVPAQQNS